MAPDINQIKLLATALKMDSAFNRVSKQAAVWIGEGWNVYAEADLKRIAGESEGEYTYNELRNKWLDIRDDFKAALKDLRGKLLRFEEEASKDFRVVTRSPILRYAVTRDAFGFEMKLFLGLDSPQAKGYRIVSLEGARYVDWLSQQMKEDPDVFYSDNYSEEEVLGLVPAKGTSAEEVQQLQREFYEDLKEAGVPAFEPIPWMEGKSERMKPAFESRLTAVIDRRLPYANNVMREERLVEDIKREHALAVAKPTVVAIGPPVSPVRLAVPVGLKPPTVPLAAAKPQPKFAKEQIVLYQGGIYEVTDMELKNGVWSYELSSPGQVLFKPEAEIIPYPKQERLEVANRVRDEQLRIVSEPTFKGYLDTVLFDLLRQEGMSLREYLMLHPELQEPKHEYVAPVPLSVDNVKGVRFVEGFERLENAFARQEQMQKQFPNETYVVVKPEALRYKYHPFEVWIVNKGYVVPEKIIVVTLTEAEKETLVLNEIKKEDRSRRGFAVGSEIWLGAHAGSYEETQPIIGSLLKKGLIVETAPGVYKLPTEAAAEKPTVKPPAKFKKDDIVKVLKGAPPDSTFHVVRSEFEDGKWFYIMWEMRGASPYRFREDELVSAPPVTAEEAKEEAKLEEEAEEERELKHEPDVTVYVKVHVEGGLEENEKSETKLETPTFVLIGTTYEEFAKHGSRWDAEGMWSRPIIGMTGVGLLNTTLKEGQVEYDAIEDNAVTWGNDWDSIREALSENPAPFNKYALFHIKWRPEDLAWEESAKKAYDIYLYKYTHEELLRMNKRELQVIAKIKGQETSGEQGELVDRVAAFNPVEAEEVEERAEEWEEEHAKTFCAGGACLLPGAYERFNLPVPKLPDAGWERWKTNMSSAIKCENKKSGQIISEEYYCDICTAELEIGEYPGGTVFPSMYPVREYNGVVCRRLWLPGGEDRVKKLIAGRIVSKDEGNYLILGSRAIEMANKADEAFAKRDASLVDWKSLLEHWDVVPPELKLRLKNRLTTSLEMDDAEKFYEWLKANKDVWDVAFALQGFEPKIKKLVSPSVSAVPTFTTYEAKDWKDFVEVHDGLFGQGWSLQGRLTGHTPQEAIEASNKMMGKYSEYYVVKVPMGKPPNLYNWMDKNYEGESMGGLWIAFYKTPLKVESRFKVGDWVEVSVAPPARPGGAGLLENVVKIVSVNPAPAGNVFTVTVKDSRGYQMTFSENDVKPAAAPMKSAADLLAQQAINELAEEALKDLERF